ncbi:MAG: glycosyltransferase [Candidatus Cloacimonadaceae bacterium]
MKICIISNSHLTGDVRLYHKLGHSLSHIADTYIISSKGMMNRQQNPHQIVVEGGSALKILHALYREAKKIKPDIVISVEPLTLLPGIALKKKLGCRLLFDLHEFFAEAHTERYHFLLRPLIKELYLALQKALLHYTEGGIAVNQEILNQLFGVHAREPRYLVLPNYPVKHVWEIPQDIPSSLAKLSDMSFDLVYIGGITESRGIIKILKSISILKVRYPHFRILIVGKFNNPDIEKDFNKSVNRFNLNANIYLQEWIPAERIGILLKRSRFGLWLFDPRVKRMSLATPLKVLEYLAAGLPVISIKTPLMKSIIERNDLGILSAYRARDIAQAISKMLDMPEAEYNAMSQRCLSISEERFNWNALEPQLFELIERLK